MRPDRLIRTLTTLQRWGLSPAVAYALAAIREPDRAAIIDERGTLTFAHVHGRTNALARALRASGIGEGETVAIMCRNHRGFIETSVACSKLGAAAIYIDVALTGAEVTEALGRDGVRAVIYDEEFAEQTHGAGGCIRFLAWSELRESARPLMLEELIAGADDADLAPPRGGPPAARFASAEGGGRRVPGSLLHPAPLLRELPLRAYETTVLAAPMCHPWGFVQMKLGMRLSSTLILHREFDPQRAAADIARHRAHALAVLPEMLQRFKAVRKTCTERASSLKVIAVNGRTLPGELAMPAIERFGAVLYSLHGPPAIRLDGYLRPRPRLPVAVGQGAGEAQPIAVQRSITVRRARRPR